MIKDNFQRTYNYESRRLFTDKCLVRDPERVPVFVYPARSYEERVRLKTNKYMVRNDMSLAQFMYFVRGRDNAAASGFVLFTDKGELPVLSQSMRDAYTKYADADGFLYIQIASESTFGQDVIVPNRTRYHLK